MINSVSGVWVGGGFFAFFCFFLILTGCFVWVREETLMLRLIVFQETKTSCCSELLSLQYSCHTCGKGPLVTSSLPTGAGLLPMLDHVSWGFHTQTQGDL